MENLNPYYERVEQFLNEAMSSEEKELFLQEIKNNPALKKELKLQKLERMAIDLLFIDKYKNKMNLWKAEEKQKNREASYPISQQKDKGILLTQRKNKFQWLSIGILSLLLIATLCFWAKENDPNTTLLADNFHSPVNSIERLSLRGEIQVPSDTSFENTAHEFKEAKKAILNKQYLKAIEKLIALNSSNPEIQYLLAHAYYGNKNYIEAIPLFENLANAKGLYQYEAKLYLMYAFLADHQSKNESFRPLLEEIISDDNYPKTVREKVRVIYNHFYS